MGKTFAEENELDAETLFLRTASFNTGRFPQEPVLRSLMNYLLNSTYVDGYNQSARIGKTVRKYVEENGASKVNEYLKAFNYDFTIEYGSESEGEGLRVTVGSNQKNIFFKRNSFPIPNEFFDESQGNQVFAVEGGNAETGGMELRLLKQIFSEIMKYEVHELRRGSEEFIGYGENT